MKDKVAIIGHGHMAAHTRLMTQKVYSNGDVIVVKSTDTMPLTIRIVEPGYLHVNYTAPKRKNTNLTKPKKKRKP